jgi:glycosyltransferase involved in cell wall biosynthesis
MSTTPRFSIVVPHYDSSIADAILLRGLGSLAAQTLRNFEVLLLHDGPLSRPLPDLAKLGLPALRFSTSAQRHNDWGHSLRDAGIRQAHGDYIVHFNPDNVLYPNALEVLDAASRAPVPPAPAPELAENPDVLIFSVLMRGMNYNGRGPIWRSRDPNHALIYTGMPPGNGLIDCMQLVARRSVWLDIGGWYDKSETSDANIYARLVQERAARYVVALLGEHW